MKSNQEYTVELTMISVRPLTEDDLAAIAEIAGAVGGNVGASRFTATLTAAGDDPARAIDAAIAKVCHLVKCSAVAAAATTIEEFDRRAAEREELVGVAEIAAMLGISRQRVTTLSKRADFPAPRERLAAGPIWRKADLSTFAEGWQRKGGRPKKAA